MNCKVGLCLLVALAMAACSAEAGVRDLRNKYRSMIGQENGGGGSAAAAAAAGSGGVSSAVAASAAAAGLGGYQGGYGAPQYYQPPVHQPHAVRKPAAHFQRPQVFMPAPVSANHYGGHHHQHHQQAPVDYYAPSHEGGLIDESAHFGAHYGHAHQPHYGHEQHYQYAPQSHHQHQRQPHHAHHAPRFAANHGPVHGYHQQGGAATSSAAAAASGGHHAGGSAAAAAAAASAGTSSGLYYEPNHDHHTVDTEEMNEHYYEPETVNHYQASAGTYGDGLGGTFEQGAYVRNTESVEKHEDGREDGDHYYNAQAYGKTNDVHNHMAYDNKDEDIIHTPNMFRKKKSKTNFVSNYDKQHRETGSGVVTHDKHSAQFNKNSKKLKENVDQRYSKGAEGLVQTKNFNSNTDIDDEDEMAMDSRGLGNFAATAAAAAAKAGVPQMPHAAPVHQSAGGAASASAAASAAAASASFH